MTYTFQRLSQQGELPYFAEALLTERRLLDVELKLALAQQALSVSAAVTEGQKWRPPENAPDATNLEEPDKTKLPEDKLARVALRKADRMVAHDRLAISDNLTPEQEEEAAPQVEAAIASLQAMTSVAASNQISRQPKRRSNLTQNTERHANLSGLKTGQDGCRSRTRWLTHYTAWSTQAMMVLAGRKVCAG
jgi:hypothetical protein